MNTLNCITAIGMVLAFLFVMRILWALASPHRIPYDDDLDEWDYIAMIDDIEHGDG